MLSRRQFIAQSVASGIISQSPLFTTSAATRNSQSRTAATGAGTRIRSLARCEDTVLRLGGIGDNYHMTWATDDRQLTAVCDGMGWLTHPKSMYNSRLFAISNGPEGASFEDIPSYPELPVVFQSQQQNRYYGFGTLAVGDRIYQYLSTPNHTFESPRPKFVGTKLIYSPDNGRTWRNQDGSSPVRWELWEDRSRNNMIFFEEDQDAFALISILQMGRAYASNSDGYIYGYSPNGATEGRMNQLVLFRVPGSRILERAAYEFYAGLKGNAARWSDHISDRVPILSFPAGWVNRELHPWAWLPSVTYNAPLDLYMMANWGNGVSASGQWFSKPSYLGIWISPTPWGPWAQVHEEASWTPAGEVSARAFSPQISPKWVAQDGRSFWLIWSDFQVTDAEAMWERFKRPIAQEHMPELRAHIRRYQPYYAFNAQRVDIRLA